VLANDVGALALLSNWFQGFRWNPSPCHLWLGCWIQASSLDRRPPSSPDSGTMSVPCKRLPARCASLSGSCLVVPDLARLIWKVVLCSCQLLNGCEILDAGMEASEGGLHGRLYASDAAAVVVRWWSLSSVMWMAWSGQWGILVLVALWL
jgi:hypothetical protein